jgi:hypothetical protein
MAGVDPLGCPEVMREIGEPLGLSGLHFLATQDTG